MVLPISANVYHTCFNDTSKCAVLFRNTIISLHKTPKTCLLPQAPILTSFIDKQWHILKAPRNQAPLIWFFCSSATRKMSKDDAFKRQDRYKMMLSKSVIF